MSLKYRNHHLISIFLIGLIILYSIIPYLVFAEDDLGFGSIGESDKPWSPPIKIPNAGKTAENFKIICSMQVIHLTWQENVGGNTEIFYMKSLDAGVSWGKKIRISNAPGDSQNPSIVLDMSGMYIVWEDRRDGNFEIYYKRSTDQGKTWGMETRLTDDPNTSVEPAVGSLAGELIVIWSDNRTGTSEIYYKISSEEGTKWSEATPLTKMTFGAHNPQLITELDTIYVAWEERERFNSYIYFSESDDAGQTWSAKERVSVSVDRAYAPQLLSDFNGLYLTYVGEGDGGRGIFFRNRIDKELGWSIELKMATLSKIDNVKPVFYSNPTGGLQVAWAEREAKKGDKKIAEKDIKWKINYQVSNDDGLSWQKRLMSNKMFNAYAVSISGNLEDTYLVWHEDRNGETIGYLRSNAKALTEKVEKLELPQGFTWKRKVRYSAVVSEADQIRGWEYDTHININSKFGEEPTVAGDAKNVFIVWVDSSPGYDELYLRTSVNGGYDWGKIVKLTESKSKIHDPQLRMFDRKLYLVWSDYRAGNNEIFFKMSMDMGDTWTKSVRLTYNSGNSHSPKMAISDKGLIIVWSDDRDNNVNEIFYKIYDIDRGKWGETTQFTRFSSDAINPAVSAYKKFISIVWQDKINEFEYKIKYAESKNFGKKWKIENNFADLSTASFNPNILIVPEGYFVTWVGDSGMGRNICLKHKHDFFDDWSIEETIEPYLTDNDIPILIPHEEGGIINLFWADFATGKYEIQRCYSDDYGISWHLQNKISKTKGISRDMDAANSLNKTYVVWCETSTNKKQPNKKIKFTTNDLRAPMPIVSSPDVVAGSITDRKTIKFQWETAFDPSGLDGFGYVLDQNPATRVDIKTCERITDSITYYELEDGRWYFHIASVDSLGNWSDTTHFAFTIGKELLALMPIEHKKQRAEVYEVKQIVKNQEFKEEKVKLVLDKIQKDQNPTRQREYIAKLADTVGITSPVEKNDVKKILSKVNNIIKLPEAQKKLIEKHVEKVREKEKVTDLTPDEKLLVEKHRKEARKAFQKQLFTTAIYHWQQVLKYLKKDREAEKGISMALDQQVVKQAAADVKEQMAKAEEYYKMRRYKKAQEELLSIMMYNPNNRAVTSFLKETKKQIEKVEAQENDPSVLKVHWVKRGETFWKIAQKYYGNGKDFVALAIFNDIDNDKYNNYNLLYSGTPLKIPIPEELERIKKTQHYKKVFAQIYSNVRDKEAVKRVQVLDRR